MSRTADRWIADNPHTGGWVWYGASQLISDSANLVYTRNAGGDWSLNRVAAGAETYRVQMGVAELRRITEAWDATMTQEQFGGSVGPIPVQGRPPFTGASFLVPPSGAPAKGITISDVVTVYTVGVAALTSASLALTKTVYANNVAPAITTPAIAPTALPLATQANPYVVTRAVTVPLLSVDDLSDIQLELTLTMANTGTIRVYGLGFHCTFNLN